MMCDHIHCKAKVKLKIVHVEIWHVSSFFGSDYFFRCNTCTTVGNAFFYSFPSSCLFISVCVFVFLFSLLLLSLFYIPSFLYFCLCHCVPFFLNFSFLPSFFSDFFLFPFILFIHIFFSFFFLLSSCVASLLMF